jgi:hypothetical protein
VFSCFLYTGNGSTQTITNNIDLSTNGGMVWIKNRVTGGTSNIITDTVRGKDNGLVTNSTGAQNTVASGMGFGVTNCFLTSGFTLRNSSDFTAVGENFVSWTFRKQPKFFDVVTYTGNGANRTIAHSLGSAPGMIAIKSTTLNSDWVVYHRSIGATKRLVLNATAAEATDSTAFNNTEPTSSVFSLGTLAQANNSGSGFVAYLFAHDAGGFGLTGTDNVISCGSYTTDGSGNATVNLGYEPQWVLTKSAGFGNPSFDFWSIVDNMRGMPVTTVNSPPALYPNSSAAESNRGNYLFPTATGFNVNEARSGATYIYIAIRRGPMKVPTLGTSVFSPNAASASAGTALVTNFPVDLSISTVRSGDTRFVSDRLRGVNSPGLTANQPWIATDSTGAELTNTSIPRGWDNTQILVPPYYSGSSTIWWNFRRAPGFFDEVCYTGTGVARDITHNLGAVPELMIAKKRSSTNNWVVWQKDFGTGLYGLNELYLNLTYAPPSSGGAFLNTPTSTVFSVSTYGATNGSGETYVAYLFATCPGVSKVGSYTGNGTTQTINCGFTGGARFVLIKRTDSTGDWYVWDSARGIVSGNDSYLLLNSTAAEVTSTDYIDTYSAGFEISSTAPAAINANGGSFIFLAIA